MSAVEDTIEDHRVRVAAVRRERMRERLLNAVTSTYTERLTDGPPSVDEVVKKADVSRATFYKYLTSVDEAIGIIGQTYVDEMVHGLISIFDGPERPFFRMTTGIQVFLIRSLIDPVWAAFVSRINYFAHDTILLTGITTHLGLSRKQGLVRFEDINVATSFVVGSLMNGIRYISRSRVRGVGYAEELETMILLGLGVQEKDARKIVTDRAAFIRKRAPERLPWWRDPSV